MAYIDHHGRIGGSLTPAWRDLLFLLALIAATLLVYSPVSRHPFTFLDDNGYVVYNLAIKQLNWETVKWSFTTYHASNWHPLTWLSHALDYRLFGLDAGRHHQTNLLFHVLNTVLLFCVLSQATGRAARSFVVAALFGLHPVNVETVAWIAERKSLLSMFFFLLALGAYTLYARRPQIGRYLAVVFLYALGLLCKPQVVTMPFVLLLWDYWPLERLAVGHSLFAFGRKDTPAISDETRLANGADRHPGVERKTTSEERFSWLVLEKLPLLALSAASAVVTVKAQRAGGTIGGFNAFSFDSRLGNSIQAYVRYIAKAFWPTRLAFFYPHSRTTPPFWQLAAASLLLLGITALAVLDRKHRYLAVGWFWFLGTMVPMIGLVQVGSQAMADRYAYLPFVGLFLAVCWAVADWTEHWPGSAVWRPVGVIAILLLLAFATRRQLNYWSDDLTLWTHSAEVVKNNYEAENMIGETLLRRGEPEEAVAHFRAAVAMEPLFTFPRLHLGIYEEEHHHPREAIEQLQRVIELTEQNPKDTTNVRSAAFVHMSFAYNQLGDYANQQKYLNMAAQLMQQ